MCICSYELISDGVNVALNYTQILRGPLVYPASYPVDVCETRSGRGAEAYIVCIEWRVRTNG